MMLDVNKAHAEKKTQGWRYRLTVYGKTIIVMMMRYALKFLFRWIWQSNANVDAISITRTVWRVVVINHAPQNYIKFG